MSNPPGATLDPRFASSHDETRSCGSQPAHISLTARRAPRPDRPPPQPTPMPAPAAGIPCWALDKRPSISAPHGDRHRHLLVERADDPVAAGLLERALERVARGRRLGVELPDALRSRL